MTTRKVTRGPTATPIVVGNLKIHPAIGVARLGNDPTNFYLGPEVPGQGPVGSDAGVGSSVTSGPFSGFKTGATTVKRQGQRFRIFLHFPDRAPTEVTLNNPQVKSIEWGVHLANTKAAFFQFDGQKGDSAANVYSPATPRRNALAPRSRIVIDPGRPQKISGKSQGPVKIDFRMGGGWPLHSITGKVVIGLLGELFTDAAGRLVVLGGRGSTRPFRKDTANPTKDPPIDTYANNDGWLDDVSDGFVTATVTMANGLVVSAMAAWILVGPPDFAPLIRNVVSMYDTLWDVAARNTTIPIPNLLMFTQEPLVRLSTFRTNNAAYRPEFFADLEPLLQGTIDQQFVFDGVSHGIPSSALASKAENSITQFVRPPAGNRQFVLGAGSMPFLYGDEYDTVGSNKQALALTQSQFTNLERWRDGKFDVGARAAGITPQGLDRAALEGCVGGAFFPGIEASWMIRNPVLYAEPFRLKPIGTVLNSGMTPPLKIQPGLFSQQMALPWQADFWSCDDGPAPDGALSPKYGWWPAQRPIVVSKGGTKVRWDRGLPPAQNALIAGWPTRGFVVKSGGGFDEQGGP